MFKRQFLLLALGILVLLRLGFFSQVDFFEWWPVSMGEGIDSLFLAIRRLVTGIVWEHLPSPHSELLLGMVIGVDYFSKLPRFNDVLRVTGTIHVVVVSGYNINLVFDFITRIIRIKSRLGKLLVAQSVTFLYALLSGFEPPVIRAWVMGTVLAWGKHCGNKVSALKALLVSALLMLFISPSFLGSLSFQLSFLASLSLLLYSGRVEQLLSCFRSGVIKEDLIATLSAQILVWPLISYQFGQVSLISPLANACLLWTVPLATALGGLILFLALPFGGLPSLAWLLVYVPLDIFVRGVRFFSKIPFTSIGLNVSYQFLIGYYAVAVLLAFLLRFYEK